jgi:hypothetical protein
MVQKQELDVEFQTAVHLDIAWIECLMCEFIGWSEDSSLKYAIIM